MDTGGLGDGFILRLASLGGRGGHMPITQTRVPFPGSLLGSLDEFSRLHPHFPSHRPTSALSETEAPFS